MEKFGPWNTYCAMVDVLETRSPTGDDIPEKAQYFLSEANPRIWQGEVSGDPAIYSEFREAFEKAFPEGAAEPYGSRSTTSKRSFGSLCVYMSVIASPALSLTLQSGWMAAEDGCV